MNITIYEVFELNRVLHQLILQQKSYKIQTAFKLHTLIKWLDDTEIFIFERLNVIFGKDEIDVENPQYKAFLLSPISFIGTDLTIEDIIETEGSVNINVEDVGILKKIIGKTEK